MKNKTRQETLESLCRLLSELYSQIPIRDQIRFYITQTWEDEYMMWSVHFDSDRADIPLDEEFYSVTDARHYVSSEIAKEISSLLRDCDICEEIRSKLGKRFAKINVD